MPIKKYKPMTPGTSWNDKLWLKMKSQHLNQKKVC